MKTSGLDIYMYGHYQKCHFIHSEKILNSYVNKILVLPATLFKNYNSTPSGKARKSCELVPSIKKHAQT